MEFNSSTTSPSALSLPLSHHYQALARHSSQYMAPADTRMSQLPTFHIEGVGADSYGHSDNFYSSCAHGEDSKVDFLAPDYAPFSMNFPDFVPTPGMESSSFNDNASHLPSTSPHTPPYSGSQSSPWSLCSDLPSDLESPHSPCTSDENLVYTHSERSIHGGYPFIGHDHTQSKAIPTAALNMPDHRRSRSFSSSGCPKPQVATQAMLDANERRRRHRAQFECDLCHQRFTAQFSLKRHQQSHTGERPYECSIDGCHQRFFNSSDCKRHEKSKKRHNYLDVHAA